jgi:hypothetical protein
MGVSVVEERDRATRQSNDKEAWSGAITLHGLIAAKEEGPVSRRVFLNTLSKSMRCCPEKLRSRYFVMVHLRGGAAGNRTRVRQSYCYDIYMLDRVSGVSAKSLSGCDGGLSRDRDSVGGAVMPCPPPPREV